jgi:hypothetical protein
MARRIELPARHTFSALLRALLAAGALIHCTASAQMHALLVGGGPDRASNTAQIEEHLRFVTSLVPASPGRIVLFADGRSASRNLIYTDSAHLSAGQRALDILLPNDGLGARELTRTPDIGAALDGPSRLASIDKGFSRLAALSGKSDDSILLYFAGHGSQSRGREQTSFYSLWGDQDLDPPTLVREIETLPQHVPVTLVMAQCFSGGFGNVIFHKANPNQSVSDRTIVGFFAAESDREAAGCGTETNSPLYQDFSSYFFGALSGRDKLGHEVTGADYDGDGAIGCYEAYCYALVHDESIDTPVSTSLIYLRHFAQIPDQKIFATPWPTVIADASPAQRAALEGLSTKLGLDGDQRVLAAYDRLMFGDPLGQPSELQTFRDAQDHLNTLRMDTLRTLFQKYPSLRWRDTRDYTATTRAATASLDQDAAHCQQLIDASDAYDRADAALDDEEALLVRFDDLVEAVVRAHFLRGLGNVEAKTRFEALWQAEQRPLGITGMTPSAH